MVLRFPPTVHHDQTTTITEIVDALYIILNCLLFKHENKGIKSIYLLIYRN